MSSGILISINIFRILLAVLIITSFVFGGMMLGLLVFGHTALSLKFIIVMVGWLVFGGACLYSLVQTKTTLARSDLDVVRSLLAATGIISVCRAYDPGWPRYMPPEMRDALPHDAIELVVGQTAFWFTAGGRYLGYLTDDTCCWVPRVQS